MGERCAEEIGIRIAWKVRSNRFAGRKSLRHSVIDYCPHPIPTPAQLHRLEYIGCQSDATFRISTNREFNRRCIVGLIRLLEISACRLPLVDPAENSPSFLLSLALSLSLSLSLSDRSRRSVLVAGVWYVSKETRGSRKGKWRKLCDQVRRAEKSGWERVNLARDVRDVTWERVVFSSFGETDRPGASGQRI